MEFTLSTTFWPVFMWQRFQNIFSSVGSYADLSPDVKTRQQVRQWLSDRPALPPDEWFTTFWQPQGIDRPLADFIGQHMTHYSGVNFAQTRPSDRLLQDLQLPLICWFDWEMTFCDDFLAQFGVDVSDRFDPTRLHTVADFVLFLQQQISA